MAEPRCRNCGSLSWDEEGRCRECTEFPTLGWLVGDWIEAKCVIPDGDFAGDQYVLTEEMWRFLLRFYRIDPTVVRDRRDLWQRPFHFSRGAQLVRPQKWGKGPFSVAIVCAEAEGPALFDGWDAEGQPAGRPWATPWIQVTAVSEGQTDNNWRALVPMIERGALKAAQWDTGETRINLPGGGRIEPPTASARSRLGQRVTFALQDQSESWLDRNGGAKLADTQRRNVAGMGGRFLETCNAWDPREASVAQRTAESNEPGVYRDDVEPGSGSVRNKVDRRRMLRKVYGTSWWVDLDRIDSEIVALIARGEAAQAERFFLNRKLAGEDAAFPPELVDARVDREHEVEDGATVTIGCDGARFVDALGLVATEVATGFQWPLGIWERPERAPGEYEHPFGEVDGALSEAFDRFRVWRVYIDPQWIDHLLETWQGRWGQKRVLPWYTNRPRQIAWAVRRYTDALSSGEATHDGERVFVQHLKSARKQPVNVFDDKHRQMHTLSKDSPDSTRKMDGAMAATLSWEARCDAVAAGVNEPRKVRAVGWA